MKIRIVHAAIVLASLSPGCSKKEDNKHSNPPAQTQDGGHAPMVSLGLNGGLVAGGVAWNLPDFLIGQFKELDKASTEAALNLDLTNGSEKKPARVNAGYSVKPCTSEDETKLFLATVAKPAADNVPASHKLDVDEVTSWTAQSKNFEGRLFLRKSYKSSGDTGIYRIDGLVTNTKASECVLWNLTFTPDGIVTASFIEGSDAYKSLMTSLVRTWEDLGSDFDE